MKDELVKLGGKGWIKNDMERVYITCDILNVLRDRVGLSSVYFGENNNKIFLDVKTNIIMRSYKNKKPQIELEFGC